MTDDLVAILIDQTRILFENVQATMQAVSDGQLYDTSICDWPLAEQLFHALHSLDQWFINPNRFTEPEIAARKQSTGLTKADLAGYFRAIKARTMNYLEKLDDGMLADRPPGCPHTRLTLVLGQYRHLMYHIGLIHGCLRAKSGGTNPPYVGLELQ